jgi:3-deoxy-7-phosphoheptulonate synthase
MNTEDSNPAFPTENLRIRSIRQVSTPARIQDEQPLTATAAATVARARAAIQDVIHGRDDRLLVIVGPCSIHDAYAAIDYARQLQAVMPSLQRRLLIVMRVYFEKPRTTIGWKGLINDPDLNDGYDIDRGLRIARRLLLQLAEMGVAAGVEFLDILTPQYLADLVSWGAIGARTTESQLHREMASGLSCPVGFKNGTDGSVRVAVDAVLSARSPHRFLSLTRTGAVSIFETTGNADTHVILRGGSTGTNFDRGSIDAVCSALSKSNLPRAVMVDCSHANSRKNFRAQPEVARQIGEQIAAGDRRIIGVMVESHLVEGRQDIGPDLIYGQSVTDACIGWEDTVEVLRGLAAAVDQRTSQLAATA